MTISPEPPNPVGDALSLLIITIALIYFGAKVLMG